MKEKQHPQNVKAPEREVLIIGKTISTKHQKFDIKMRWFTTMMKLEGKALCVVMSLN